MVRRRRRRRARVNGSSRRFELMQNDTTGFGLSVPDVPVRIRTIERVVAITTDATTATAPFSGLFTMQFYPGQLGSTTVLPKLATVYRYWRLHSIRYFYSPVRASTDFNGFRCWFSINDDPVTNLSGDTAPTSTTILNQGRVSLSNCLFNYHTFPLFTSKRGWLYTDIQTESTAVAQRSVVDHEVFGLLAGTATSTAYGDLWAEIDVSFRGRTFNRTAGLDEKSQDNVVLEEYVLPKLKPDVDHVDGIASPKLSRSQTTQAGLVKVKRP